MNPTELYETSFLRQLAEQGRSLQEEVATSYARSRLGQAIDALVHFVRQSYLFQWLTAEPDPDVIVIDLRETYTVGPFLAVLDRLVPFVARSWRESRIRTFTTASEHRLRTQPVRLLSVVLVVALAVNTLLALVTEAVTPIEFGVRVAVLVLALAGTQARHSWDELTETRLYALTVALLEPPDVPAEEDERESGVDEREL